MLAIFETPEKPFHYSKKPHFVGTMLKLVEYILQSPGGTLGVSELREVLSDRKLDETNSAKGFSFVKAALR